ncbi:MAG: hypothetical protein R3343_05915 [Nitriliruptorales bacterium]|nr:hypothetical protein [Nitriliruptorales bacterium]
MSERLRRLGLVAVVVAAGLLPGAPAAAAGACPTLDDGVTVVVDFQDLGGGIHVRCAPGDPSSGFAALTGAGFSFDEVASWPGVVCRIDGLPGTDREDCQDMPPGDAYWAYFHAERSGSWSFSGSGAGSYDPAVGSVEGWSFSEGGGAQEPREPPPPAPAPQPEPEQEPEPEPEPEPAEDSEPQAQQEPAEETLTAPSPTSTVVSPSPAESTATSPSPTPEPSATPEPVPQGAAALEEPPSGTPWATVITLVVVALLGIGALVIQRRRVGP